MKKFLIAAISLVLLYLFWDTAYYRWGWYIDLGSNKEISAFTAAEGKTILVNTGNGLKPYEIKGVDLGAAIPGHFATEYAIDKETYLRWFGMIQEMGANTIRVYTILSSEFYNAVYEYNKDNPNPLYILHGVWVDDYVQNSHVDAYDDAFFDTLKKDCRTLVDIIHGNRKLNLGNGASGSGVYGENISPWVLGYILGVEWEDVTVAYTDHMQTENNSYQGKYMYTVKGATPFEAMLAEVGDTIIRYESHRYGEQRLVAFSNWPTTDPLDYPELVNELFMKCAQVDVEHIQTTDKFISGQFASYHIYSYFPDYLRFFDSWQQEIENPEKFRLEDDGGYNTYGAYLQMINNYHTMPVVISEFGVPTSRGRAQTDHNTSRSQGYMSEKEQGEALVSCYNDIKNAGCAGSVIFSWQDEWFKRTWNTMANVDLTTTAYWSDFMTNEQFFGLLSFDPGRGESVCYTDGDVSEWEEKDFLTDNGDYKLYMKYDEKFVYFRIHKVSGDIGTEKLYLPVDVTPKTGSYYALDENIRFNRAADFLIIVNGEDNSKVMVQERYNAFYVIFAEDYENENPYFRPPAKDSPVFQDIFQALQIGMLNAQAESYQLPEKFQAGKLTRGNGDPGSTDYNSISDHMAKGNEMELRIPWQMLNFSNPSEMEVHDDYYENYGIENLAIDSMYVGIGSDQEQEERILMEELELKGWGKKPTYHERLKQSYYMVQELWNTDS